MDHASDPVDSLKPADSSLAPLAMLGVALTGLTAFLAWPGRRSSASTRKRQALIAYLRDHLTGSDVAIRVVHRLRLTHHGTDGMLFHRLFKEFEEDPVLRHKDLQKGIQCHNWFVLTGCKCTGSSICE